MQGKAEHSETLAGVNFIVTRKQQHAVSDGFVERCLFNRGKVLRRRAIADARPAGSERGGKKYMKAMAGETWES